MFIGDISKIFAGNFRSGSSVFNKFAKVNYMPGVLDLAISGKGSSRTLKQGSTNGLVHEPLGRSWYVFFLVRSTDRRWYVDPCS